MCRWKKSSRLSTVGWRWSRVVSDVQQTRPRKEGPRHIVIHALARLRVTLGFVFGAIVLALAHPTPRSLGVGLSLAAAGEAIRFWAAGHLKKGREVTSSGPYKFVAHPLYVGSSVMGVGLAIACASLTAATVIIVYLVTTLTAAVKSEETFLRRAFGEQYELYRESQRARVRMSPVAARRRFSLAQAIANREHRALTGFMIVTLLLVLKATYNGVFRAAAGP
jgi:protein-S-isoprenylcysteine O-methyltransferase Ste14